MSDHLSFAERVNFGFGYNYVGDKRSRKGIRMDRHTVIGLNAFKVAMYIPIINLIAIGIILTVFRPKNVPISSLITNPRMRPFAARMMISLVAAPLLLPIDILATLILRPMIAHEARNKKFAGMF